MEGVLPWFVGVRHHGYSLDPLASQPSSDDFTATSRVSASNTRTGMGYWYGFENPLQPSKPTPEKFGLISAIFGYYNKKDKG
eukprot:scaffold167351_cov15-Prasinocladus_malaysianus.AAC.1